jgi:ankyrin repeat protein
MSTQENLDAFISAAGWNLTFTYEGVVTAVGIKGIPVNGRASRSGGVTALHNAVFCRRRELVVALLAVGADTNMKNRLGDTMVSLSAWISTADIVQLLIHGGGSVNELGDDSQTPLIAAVIDNCDDITPTRLSVFFACSDLDLDATFMGKTAEEWAIEEGKPDLKAMIMDERRKRQRWSRLRFAWVAATGSATTSPRNPHCVPLRALPLQGAEISHTPY